MASHSKYAFSGSNRWLKDRCSASINKQRGKPNKSNDAAEIGTAAHELGEFCIKMGAEPIECLGLSFNKRVVDHDMINAVEVYVGHIRANRPGAMLEERVGLALDNRDDIYGTADSVLILGRTLFVDDYKHGFGVVEVLNNTQLICYAVATLDTFNAWFKVDKIIVTVVQPRANHIDGVIRSHTYTVAELMPWRDFIIDSIRAADDPHAKAIAGSWCKWCLAAPTCKPRIIQTINIAFDDDGDVTDEQLIALYPEIDIVKSHLDAIANRVRDLAISGMAVPKYKTVKKRTRAKCIEDEALAKECVSIGIKADDLYDRKLKSKTNITPVIGKDLVSKYFVSEDAGLDLVSINDNRPAVSNQTATNIFNGVS